MTLENLLNTLIQRGWKPFNMEATGIEYRGGPEFILRHYGRNKNGNGRNVRNLVSKESGLWQFVCDNKLQNTTDGEYERRLKKASDCWGDGDEYNTKNDGGYEYRVIESALKDESELEQFLLENILISSLT